MGGRLTGWPRGAAATPPRPQVCLVTISMELVTNRLCVLGARKIGFLAKPAEKFSDARIRKKKTLRSPMDDSKASSTGVEEVP